VQLTTKMMDKGYTTPLDTDVAFTF